MMGVGKVQARRARRAGWAKAAVGLLLFVLGYGFANRVQLTHAVVYRLAADDPQSAAIAFAFLSFQALVLFAALVFFPLRWAAALVVLAGASILVNHGYGGIVRAPLDGGTLAWIVAETRQAGHAAGQFTAPLLLAGAQTAAALALFVAARVLLRASGLVPQRRSLAIGAAALLFAPSLAARIADVWPEGAERNLYGFGWDLVTAPPPPPRAAVTLVPDTKAAPRHIVWLIDESVAFASFRELIAPKLAKVPRSDFGMAAALGNCSAPAQVALRSGVDVLSVGESTDLRRTPSIWGYAKRAGYRTMLIDGQAGGAPQNLLLPPEAALIDGYRAMAGGIDTDLKIAKYLNAQLKTPGKSFTFVVLRGVHFQYRDHYPKGAIPAGSPVMLQYATALKWSKRGFFAALLAGVDRQAAAIAYTSDHGQNLAPGAMPHCSREGVADEFRVPLLAFLPDRFAARYADAPHAGHSASQIFPATLIWMGYDPAKVAAHYDRDLTQTTARYVWFGRTVVPVAAGGEIDVTAGPDFPGTAEQ